jgi:hypothetical protein
VQETLLRAIANIDSFHPGTNMSAWLFTILRNLFRSEYRKRRREVEDTDGSYVGSLKSSPQQHSRVEFEEFRGALAKLLPDQREALILVGASGLLLRGGRRHLRERGRDDQEPGQAARGAALHRQRRQIRAGSNDACYSDPGRARLIARRKGMVPAPAMRRWVTAEAVQQQSLPRCERRQLGSDGGHGRGGREELLVRLPMALARSPCRSGDNLTRPTRKGVEV